MKRSAIVVAILIPLWVITIGVGIFVLMKYEFTPGIGGMPGAHWPSNTQIPLSIDRPTLVMFVHPQCPCTRASIIELGKLITNYKNRLKAYVLLFSPKSVPSGWDRTALRNSAQSIPGVIVLSDIDGIEASRFHSVTSGQTMIYNPHGQLLFSGGITAARGQEGDNPSLNSAKLALDIQSSKTRKTLVFGCSLISSNKK